MARLARLGLGSGLGGKASAVGELLGLELLTLELLALELLRRSSELLGPGSQKLLLGLLGLLGLAREGLGSKLLGPTLGEELLGLLLLGELGLALSIQLRGKAGSEGSEGSVLEGLARGRSLALLNGLEAELNSGSGSSSGLWGRGGGRGRLGREGQLLWLLLGLGKGKLLLWLSRETGGLSKG